MTEFTERKHVDPLEGSSSTVDVTVKVEISPQHENEDNYNTMDLFELATCVVVEENHQEPIDFPTTDAVFYPKSGLMVCLLCLEDVETNLLGDHMLNAHNYRTVRMKCSVCGMKFGDRSLLTAHKKQCKPPEKRSKRKSFQQIMKELDTKDYDNDLTTDTCPMCSLELPRYCLRDHMVTEHMAPELSLTCETCKRSFKNKLTLREHIKLVHDSVEETEECELCGQKFRSQKYLSNHKRNVHPADNKIHTCPTCGKTFKSRLCLHQHGKYVHPPASAAVACPHCPHKLFKSKINLHQHLRVSHGEYKKDPELV